MLHLDVKYSFVNYSLHPRQREIYKLLNLFINRCTVKNKVQVFLTDKIRLVFVNYS